VSPSLPARGAVFVRLDDDHLDGDGGAQQVDHLLVGERGHRHLADLHQPAALPQARLPGEAEGLHVGHDALEVDVEAQLAQAVTAQDHLRGLAAPGGDLEPEQQTTSALLGRQSTMQLMVGITALHFNVDEFVVRDKKTVYEMYVMLLQTAEREYGKELESCL